MGWQGTRSWKPAAGFFFFQAEDGIRDYKVTGVQTCALPISTMGAGVTLWPNASFVLQELGLLQDIKAIGGRPLTMRRQDAVGNALGGLDIALLDRMMGYPTYTVLRRHLQEVLLDHAARAGIPVEFGHRAVAIELDANGRAMAHFDNGASTRPDLLIGADGRMDSVARKVVAGDNTPDRQ